MGLGPNKLRHALGWLVGRGRSAVAAFANHPVLRRRALVLVAALLVGSYAAGVLIYVLLTPELGFRCAFTTVVNYFDSAFLFPHGQEPLRAGDKIVEVGGRPVANWSQLLRQTAELNRETPEPLSTTPPADPAAFRSAAAGKSYVTFDGERVVRVVYQRGEATHSVWCRLRPAPAESLLPSILWFCLKIGLFLVGAIVYWKRPEDRSAAQFFLLCICSSGAYLGGYQWWRIVTQPILLVLFMVCAMLLPAVSLHFYLLFPRPKRFLERQPRWSLVVLYGPPLAFLLLLLTGYLRIRWLYYAAGPGGPPPEAVHALLVEMLYEILVYFGVALCWYVASVASLVHSYRTAVNLTERNQVKWILFGVGAALAPIAYSVYLAYWEKEKFGGGGATLPMFAASLCVTAAFTVSITRYRLMQLDQLLSSGVVYFLISFVAGLVYYGLVFAAMFVVGRSGSEGPSLGHALAVSTTALVLTVALDLIRGRFKKALDRHFRREKNQLDRTLQRMSLAIAQLVDPPALARRLLHTSADLLGVPRGAVYLRDGEPALYCLADALGPPPPLDELSSGCPLVEALADRGPLLARPRSAAPDPAQRQLLFLGGEVAYALRHEGALLGILLLGPKEVASYTPEDFNLLAAFSQITVLALVSAEGHRTIETLNRELQTKVEKIAEQQRRILALQSQLTDSAARRAARLREKAGDEEAATNGADAARAPADETTADVPGPADGLVGSSPEVKQLLGLVRKVAASPSAVLLRGESGTGKELLARAVHECSPRAGKAFVKVHCAALSPTLLESELFGHVKGAFTNAIRDKVGRFEAAHGGTLFLDEIGDITLEVQTKLLRVLQEMTFERVGSSEPVRVDMRIIAATHQDLEGLIRQGRFREDLFYRLNVFPIVVPPLRARAEDVPELALHFLRLYAKRSGKAVAGIDDDALCLLKGYGWPGNVRQLENVIERAVVIAERPVIRVEDLPEELLGADEDLPSPESSAEVEDGWGPANGLALAPSSVVEFHRAERERREREQLVRALASAGGNKAEAARALGVARSTLVSRLKRLGLS